MSLLWVLAVAVLLALGAVGYFVWRSRQMGPVNFAPEWIAEFSAARYQPMERLLADEDFTFLREHLPDGDKVIARLRAERRAIFRSYLSQMSRDFGRLMAVGKLMVLYSPQDRSDLASALFQQEIRFRVAWFGAHGRLVLHSMGLAPMSLKGLVSPIQQLSTSIQQPQGAGL